MSSNDQSQSHSFVPALGYRILTPLYDPILQVILRENHWKPPAVKQLSMDHGKVLDLGCGTGTLTVEIAKQYPESVVHGVDIDLDTLNIAQKKSFGVRGNIRLLQGTITDLPYSDAQFDCVISSLVFHHLTTEQKLKAISEVKRVLRKNGEFHLIDWGEAASRLQRAMFYGIQLLDSFETTQDNIEGNLPNFLEDFEFEDVMDPEIVRTPLGTIRIHRVVKL